MTQKPSKKEAAAELWRRGLLKFKLDSVQKELYDIYYNKSNKINTWLLARRSGKTYTLCILALEQCIRKPNAIVKFAAPTKLQIRTILRPLFKQILDDCPSEIKPEYRPNEYTYYFPNGSEIQLAGTDSGHAEKLRGTDSDLWIVDEAGSCQDLNNVVKNILLPTTLITKGKGILASTPPMEPDHEFIGYIEEAELKNSLIKRTIEDNPRISKEQKDELIAELGGIESDACRRELYCELIKSINIAVLPEFNNELEAKIKKVWPRPPYFDCYASMDLGFKDLTVVLFAYYDFRADKVVVEDELVLQGVEVQIPKLTKEIREKETKNWFNPLTNEVKTTYLRVSDINHIVLSEINRESSGLINFIGAKKDDNQAAINNLRVMLANEKIIINPQCVTLLRHLKNVKWYSPTNHEKFARSPDDGHYDAVDALKYLVRHISYNKNPYPPGYNLNLKPGEHHINNYNQLQFAGETPINVYKKIFNVKKRN